jgi:undecaprenyl phosphate-alpha-L-ara4FN deformylase
MRLATQFEQLVLGWKAQGWTIGPVRALYESVEPMALPRCTTAPGTVEGRTGTLLVQGDEFLGDVDLAQAA